MTISSLKKQDKSNIESFCKDIIAHKLPDLSLSSAQSFVSKAYLSGMIKNTNINQLSYWFNNIFLPNHFSLDYDDYCEAAIQALFMCPKVASTDYGTSRERDFGQKWTDTIRGYLGEIAIRKFFFSKFGLKIELGHDEGTLEEYKYTDIHQVKLKNENEYRQPRLDISIKSIKCNGLWLDIPGDQLNHSDIFIVASLGIETNHLFSFFKKLSVFELLMDQNERLKLLDNKEIQKLVNHFPSFKQIIGYVPGFQLKAETQRKPNFEYDGQKGKEIYTIRSFSGFLAKDFKDKIKDEENAKDVKFEGIGNFSSNDKYIFGIGFLKNSLNDWNKFVLDKI